MIRAILACHDRRDLTVVALGTLREAAEAAGTPLAVVLFDDGSSDGTAAAAAAVLPEGALTVVQGDGSAFWANGMAAAEAVALEQADEDDLLLWINDDVRFEPTAVRDLLDARGGRVDRVVVGATVDPDSGELNYGGYVRDGVHPLRLRHVPADGEVHPVTTLNGNCLLVPVPAARRIGGIDGGFSHALADIDYGFRVRAAGLDLVQAARAVGACRSHDAPLPRPIGVEWREFVSVKGGGHPASMVRILRRSSPRAWPVFAAWSYGAWGARAGVRAVARRRRTG